METRLVNLKKGQTEILVSLEPDIKEMKEVVVTGYGNVRKTSFTGNSVTVTKDELMSVSKSNVIKALQTFDPSFRIQTNNDWGSDPNALPEMYVRGRSGISGVKELDRDPLTKSALKDNPNLPTFIMDGSYPYCKYYHFERCCGYGSVWFQGCQRCGGDYDGGSSDG